MPPKPPTSACSAPGAARGAYEELAPQFEKATGHKLITHYGLPSELLRKLDGGEPADAIILSFDIERLIKQAKVVAGPRVVLGRTGVGSRSRKVSLSPRTTMRMR